MLRSIIISPGTQTQFLDRGRTFIPRNMVWVMNHFAFPFSFIPEADSGKKKKKWKALHLSNLSPFIVGERRLRGGLINVYKYLKGSGRQMDEARLFSVVHGGRPKSNGLKLQNRKVCTNMRKNFLTVRLMEHWNRLPREVVESPSMEILKTYWGAYLCNLQ